MEEERLRVRQEELARLRVEFAMSVAAEGPAAEGAEGADEEGDVGAPDGVVAVLDGESGGPAEVQNEVPENAMEPEAKDFDPEAFLSVRGYESVAAPTGEVNGDGSPGPVDVPEVVVAEPEVSEPEGLQEIPGTGGGDFDDAGFGPVDEKWFPCRRLMAAMLWARGRMLATLKSLVRWSPMSLWLLRWRPVAAQRANVTTPCWRRCRNCRGWGPRAGMPTCRVWGPW